MNIRSYLVQWTGFAVSTGYVDWVKVADVSLSAVEAFDPPPGLHGEEMVATAKATAEYDEYASTVAGGIVRLTEHDNVCASLAFCDQLPGCDIVHHFFEAREYLHWTIVSCIGG